MARPSTPRPPAQPDHRTASDLLPVLPMTAEVKEGHLWIGGVDMVELAYEAGTALYVMDEETIRHQLSEYVTWTRYHWKDVDVVYAGKAFLSLAMVRIVEEEGCCLLCASGGELAYAVRAGFPMERVQMHGNNKTPAELVECLDAGIGRVVVDNFEEMERLSALAAGRGVTQKVLVRVTPGVEADTHDFIMTGAEDSKFGFGLNQGLAMEAVKRAVALPGLEFEGVHMHIGQPDLRIAQLCAGDRGDGRLHAGDRRTRQAIRCACSTWGRSWRGVWRAGRAFHGQGFRQVVVDGIKEQCQASRHRGPRWPSIGRSIVARAGVTLYTVGSVKEIPGIRTYVAVDGGMSDNIRTSLYDAYYEAVIANKADQPREMVGTIAGKHCESGDIVVRDGSLQCPEPGDVVCVAATGAYCQSMSSNYNKQVRPGVVFVRDGQWRWVVRRETYDDLLRTDVG